MTGKPGVELLRQQLDVDELHQAGPIGVAAQRPYLLSSVCKGAPDREKVLLVAVIKILDDPVAVALRAGLQDEVHGCCRRLLLPLLKTAAGAVGLCRSRIMLEGLHYRPGLLLQAKSKSK